MAIKTDASSSAAAAAAREAAARRAAKAAEKPLARNLGGTDDEQAMRLWDVSNGAAGSLADRNLSRIDATVTVN